MTIIGIAILLSGMIVNGLRFQLTQVSPYRIYDPIKQKPSPFLQSKSD